MSKDQNIAQVSNRIMQPFVTAHGRILSYGNIQHQHHITLKEKSGAEMAPGWSRFHVHRRAPFRYLLVPLWSEVPFFSQT